MFCLQVQLHYDYEDTYTEDLGIFDTADMAMQAFPRATEWEENENIPGNYSCLLNKDGSRSAWAYIFPLPHNPDHVDTSFAEYWE